MEAEQLDQTLYEMMMARGSNQFWDLKGLQIHLQSEKNITEEDLPFITTQIAKSVKRLIMAGKVDLAGNLGSFLVCAI